MDQDNNFKFRYKREKYRQATPYQRPTQSNESFFQRGTNKVKSVLTNLISVASNYFLTNEESEDRVHFANQDSVDHISDVQGQVSRSSELSHQQLTYNHDYDYQQPSTSRQTTGRAALNATYNPDYASTPAPMAPSTSRFADNCDTDIHTIHQQQLASSSKTTTIEQDADDGSSSDDATASSTSGCLSLVPSHQDQFAHHRLMLGNDSVEKLRRELMKKTKDFAATSTETSSKANSSNRSSLWSGNVDRSALGSKQFSVEKFLAPSSIVRHKSPFYEGKTVFGGAATKRISRLTSSPYSLPNQKLAPIIRVNVGESIESKLRNEGLSSAARKILESLEKESTPIQDAKRMPLHNDQKSRQMNLLTQQLSHSHPYRRSNAAPRISLLPQAETTTNAVVKPISLELRKKEEVAVQNSSTSPTNPGISDSLRRMSDLSSGGGKMRSHISKVPSRLAKMENLRNAVVEQANLPNVPLILASGNLPKFNFFDSSKANSNTCIVNSPITTKVVTTAPEGSDGFKFSSPILVNSNQNWALDNQSPNMKSFEFSKPISPEMTPNDVYPSLSTNLFSNFPKGSSSPLPQTTSSPSPNKSENKPDLIIGGSVMDVLNKNSSAKKESAGPVSNWGDQFKPPSGSWNCPACMIVNNADKQKCIACETAKPGANVTSTTSTVNVTNSWGDKFKPPNGSWNCPECFISNLQDKTHCVACTAPNPKNPKKSSPTKTLASNNTDLKTNDNSAGWQCDICMAHNKNSDTKCGDCETVKSGKVFSSDNKDMFSGFKFGNTSTPSTTTAFKFGIPISSDKNESLIIPNFGTNKNTSEVKFGFPNSEKTITASESKTEVPNFFSSSTNLTDGSQQTRPLISNSPEFKLPTTVSSVTSKVESENSKEKELQRSQPVSSGLEGFLFNTSSGANHLSVPQTSNTGSLLFSSKDKSAENSIPKSSSTLPGFNTHSKPVSKSESLETVSQPSIFGNLSGNNPPLITNSVQSTKPSESALDASGLFSFGATTSQKSTENPVVTVSSSFSNDTTLGANKPFTFGSSNQNSQLAAQTKTSESDFKFNPITNNLVSDKIFGGAKPVFGITTSASSGGISSGFPITTSSQQMFNFKSNSGSPNKEKNTLPSTNLFGSSVSSTNNAFNPLSSSQNVFGSFTSNPPSVDTAASSQQQNTFKFSQSANIQPSGAPNSSLSSASQPAQTTSSSQFCFTRPTNVPSSQFNFQSFGQNEPPKAPIADMSKPSSTFQFGSANPSITGGFNFGNSSTLPPTIPSFGQQQQSTPSIFGTAQNAQSPPPFQFNSTPQMNADPFKPQTHPETPSISFNQNPTTFNFGSQTTNNGSAPFMFSAPPQDPSTIAAATGRNIKKAKRRLGNQT